jgi:Resolvase, N terminal domain
VDTTTPSGRLTISILAAIAEFERELIQARMAEGRKRASKLDPRWPDIISRGLGSPSVGPHRHVLSWPSTSRGSPANSSDSEHFWFAGEGREDLGPSLDGLKVVLNDREWLDDPDAKAEKSFREVRSRRHGSAKTPR